MTLPFLRRPLSPWHWIALLVIAAVFILAMMDYFNLGTSSAGGPTDIYKLFENEEPAPPAMVPVTPMEVDTTPKDTSALGGLDVLIADRGNNRLIVVTPDKQIIWEYDFKGLPPGYGADDAFFTDGGKTVIVSMEYYHVIEMIDYQSKKILWQYGIPGTHGSGPGYLYHPDDAYKLPNGDVIVADIQNCRVIEVSPAKEIVHQYGKTRQCGTAPGFVDAPNSDTPLPNGHILVSTILNHSLTELDSQWNVAFSMQLPMKYPSDPQMAKSGDFIIAGYTNPGRIIEIGRDGVIAWEFDGVGTTTLNKPSLAEELPNGNIIANDDYNHRIIVVDKQTGQIVWQYGVTGKPGNAPGQLNIPDGLDVIPASSLPPIAPASTSTPHTVGEVTRHPGPFIGTSVRIRGYLLKKENGYVIISDEPMGSISRFDLPVTGSGIDAVRSNQSYEFDGIFLNQGLTASNGSNYHLELSSPPTPVP